MNQRGYLSVALIMVLLVVVVGSFLYFKEFFKQNPSEFSANSNIQDEVRPSNESRIMMTPDREYSILVDYKNDGKGNVTCKKTLYDDSGFERNFEMINYYLENVGCLKNPSLNLDGFKNFSGYDLVFNKLGTEVNILNVTTGEIENVTYTIDNERQDYSLMGADTTFRYLLFSKDGYPYIDQIKDFNNNEVFNIQPLLLIDNNYVISSYFDSVNHGILYLTDGSKDYRFSYFDLSTKTMRHLRTITRKEALGRGCDGNSLYPEKNTLRFMAGCMSIPTGYRNDSGELIFKL